MNKINWEERYNVGHPILDKQHQQLVGIYNNLVKSYNELGLKQDSDFHEQLNELVNFAHAHIETEQNILAEYQYECLAEHKIEHEVFAVDLSELLFQAMNGKSDKQKLLDFIANKWLKHIFEIDQSFSYLFKPK
jgi:hemerythrin-like metal-binding protein